MSKTFGELVEYDIGGGWGTEAPEPGSSSIGYVIRGTDIPRVAVGDVSTVPRRYHKASNLASRVLRPGDIVLEVSGGSKGQPVGRALQVTESMLSKFDEPVMCASFCKLIRISKGEALPGFVFRVLQAAYADGRLDTYQVQSTGISNFKWKPFLEHFEVELPSQDVQARVASALDAFDDLIENNRRRVAVLEEMARAIYREWFVKFRYPCHESVPLVDSALGPIPAEWGIEPFDDIASFVNGFAFKPSHWGTTGRPIIKIKELKAGVTVDTPRCSADAIDKKYWVEGGDLLMSWSADLGVYLWGDEPGLLNQHLFIVRPAKDSATLLYLLHALDNAMPDFRARAQGTTMTHIKRAALHEVVALIPPPISVARFDEVVGPIHRESMTLKAQTRELTAMRDLLLPKLVTGQIDVLRLDLDAVLEETVA